MSAPPKKRAEANSDEGVPAGARVGGGIAAWLLGSKIRLGLLLTFLIVALSLGWYLTSYEPPPRVDGLLQALELLDDSNNRLARENARVLAKQLRVAPERNADFLGGPEFILGLALFRDAEESGEGVGQSRHSEALKLLNDAKRRGLADDREPEWLHAVGTLQHRLGAVSVARPLLERAMEVCTKDRDEVMSLLIDISLDQKSRDELERALTLSNELVKLELTPEKHDRALMQRAQIFMALGRTADAESALKEVSEESWNLGTRLFNAQTLMARKEYREALKSLERVANDGGLDRTFPRQASYLMGLCAEKQGDIDTAITQFERTAARFDRSHEALASQVRAAALLRQIGRKEEALAGYRAALRSVKKPEDFRNRFITIDEFRKLIVEAWEGWVKTKDFAEAIDLTAAMMPLFTQREAKELEARGQHAWADSLDAEWQKARWDEQETLRGTLLERWRKSASAYAELAELESADKDYPDTLWLTAEQFIRGRDYERAVAMIDRFIETRPEKFLPMARVRRGQVLKDLDRSAEALAQFQQVIRESPTDPAVFEARFLMGVCQLELGRPDEAEKVWRSILTAVELTPDAEQWRKSLLELGKLLCHSGTSIAGKARANPANAAGLETLPAEAYARWDEATQKLHEFVSRYPTDPNVFEALYLLARSRQYGAGQVREKLLAAETENSRLELRRTLNSHLDLALEELQKLRTGLLEMAESTGLDPLHQKMLRNVFFEIPGVLYSLEQYDKAVIAYSGAANRYPQDPHVLLAYLQMAECYERLGKQIEARSMLQQARVIFAGMQRETFSSRDTSLNRDEWNQWLVWAARLRESGGLK